MEYRDTIRKINLAAFKRTLITEIIIVLCSIALIKYVFPFAGYFLLGFGLYLLSEAVRQRHLQNKFTYEAILKSASDNSYEFTSDKVDISIKKNELMNFTDSKPGKKYIISCVTKNIEKVLCCYLKSKCQSKRDNSIQNIQSKVYKRKLAISYSIPFLWLILLFLTLTYNVNEASKIANEASERAMSTFYETIFNNGAFEQKQISEKNNIVETQSHQWLGVLLFGMFGFLIPLWGRLKSAKSGVVLNSQKITIENIGSGCVLCTENFDITIKAPFCIDSLKITKSETTGELWFDVLDIVDGEFNSLLKQMKSDAKNKRKSK